MPMSKKHYIAIAAAFKNRLDWYKDNHSTGENCQFANDLMPEIHAVKDIAIELCNVFACDNPNFDKARFLIACGIEP